MKLAAMMMIKKAVFLFLLILFPLISFSQDDFGIWLGGNAKHELWKNLDAELSGCIRTINNTSQIEQSFLEGGVQYKLSKILSFLGSYRVVSNIEDNSKYYFRHKLFLDVKTSFSFRNFVCSGRARIQRTTKTYIEDKEDLISKYYGRYKLKVAYDTPVLPLKPYIYCEPFFPVFSGSDFTISKNRFSGGVEFQITDRNSVEAEYIFQRDYKPHISDIHIISLNYDIRF